MTRDDLREEHKLPVKAKRGRPRKKQEVTQREKELRLKVRKDNEQGLIAQAVALFKIPYDDRIQRPSNAPTIYSVSEALGTTRSRVRKLLISAGYNGRT